MQKTILGKTGYEISRVIFGGIVVMDETQADADRFVSYAVDKGVNYFDVAPSYGNAEERLGPALKSYRDKVFLACKTTERGTNEARKELEQSLKNLKTDYFDVYQLHSLSEESDLSAFEEGGAMETLLQAKKEGLIRNIGITAHNEDIALQALSKYDFVSLMFPVNWALGLGKNVGKLIENHCTQHNMGLFGMKTLAHRLWHDDEERMYPKSWCKIIFNNDRLGKCALKYTFSCNTTAVVPPGNFESFDFALSNVDECLDNPLNDEDIKYLKEMLPKENEHIFPY